MGESSGTAVPGLRERKKIETRKAIHKAALRSVTQHGFGAATVDDICAEAGISARTFFNYYPTKIAAAVGVWDVELGDEHRDWFLRSPGPLMEDTCVLVAQTMRLPADYGVVADIIGHRPELGADLWVHKQRCRRQVLDLLVERTGDEDLSDLVIGVVLVAFRTAARRSPAPDDPVTMANHMRDQLRRVGNHLWPAPARPPSRA